MKPVASGEISVVADGGTDREWLKSAVAGGDPIGRVRRKMRRWRRLKVAWRLPELSEVRPEMGEGGPEHGFGSDREAQVGRAAAAGRLEAGRRAADGGAAGGRRLAGWVWATRRGELSASR
ncbi:hypothetical protein E3N88_12839 [Mikania micrantha]|uniref:Uncharacterized protein n=1 Tax=Mikania micrantha TaxID=192012 RepID=A0A5N6P6T3_9ASTR|nr:hypothetical protein E3N88_12839 [Mikania micrantha]